MLFYVVRCGVVWCDTGVGWWRWAVAVGGGVFK